MATTRDDHVDAERWRKLIRLLGSPKNATDTAARMFTDDATNECFIYVGKDAEHARSFDEAMDNIPDVCRFCFERHCYCCPGIAQNEPRLSVPSWFEGQIIDLRELPYKVRLDEYNRIAAMVELAGYRAWIVIHAARGRY